MKQFERDYPDQKERNLKIHQKQEFLMEIDASTGNP